MIHFLRQAMRRRFLQTVLILGLVPVAAFSLLSPFSREIVYDMHAVFSMCQPGGECVGRVELIIGNTGDTNERVTLVWPRLEGPWSRDHNVLDISADQPRQGDPVIDCVAGGGRQECTIEQFPAGALVVMHLDCLRCSKRELGWVADTPLQVQSAAHVSYGDPRVTLLFRRLMSFAQLFT